MVVRLRDFFNALINAPAKPSRPSPVGPGKKGRLSVLLDRLLSGPSSTDPLYLTNRTFFQKARVWLLVGVPVTAIVALVVLSVTGYFDREPVQSAQTLASDSVAAQQQTLPNLDQVKVNLARDVDLLEVDVTRGPATALKGKVRNNTDRPLRSIEMVFNLTDGSGSRIGAVSVHLANLKAHAVAEFLQPLEEKTAFSAIIRDVHTE